MFYDFDIPIPANTAEDDPYQKELHLTKGVIHRVEIEFPAGCAGLAHLKILKFNAPLWPTNPEGSFHSDNHVIAFNEAYELSTWPYTLTVKAWNEDDTYQHTLKLRLGILPAELIIPEKGLRSILSRLARRLRL